MLFILCGATGLWIGEALGIRIEQIRDGGTRVIIVEKAWNGQIHDFLKTDNGEREVDVHPAVAKLLLEYVGDRKSGLLFCSSKGKQLWQSNIRRHPYPALKRVGFPKSGNTDFAVFVTRT
jgi:integrase